MKILSILVFLSLNINATEISDLMYFLKPNTFETSTSLSIHKEWFERVNNTTALRESDITNKSTLLNEEFSYGVMDHLAVGLNFGYVASDKEITDFVNSTTSVTKTSKGLNNFGFLVKYRLLDEKDKPVSLDFKLYLSPSIQRKSLATTSIDGNSSRGSFLSRFDVFVGSKLEKFSWRVLLSLTKTFDSTGDSALTNLTTTDFKGYLDFLVEARAQMVLSEQFSLEAGLGAYQVGSRLETTKLTPIITTNYDSYTDIQFFSKLNYEVFPAKFLISAEGSYSLSTESNTTVNTTVYKRRKPGKFDFIFSGSYFF